MAPRRQYSAAVIGCGKIGIERRNYAAAVSPGTHAEALRRNPRVRLVALADPDRSRRAVARSYYPSIPAYASVGELLKHHRIDIASVAAPTALHRPLVTQLTKAKVQLILCEKPVAYSLRDADAIVASSRKNRVPVIINHQRHFDPLLTHWAARIRKNVLGAVIGGDAYYYNGLFNNGTHLIDLLGMFMGSARSVAGEMSTRTSADRNDPNIDGTIWYNSGASIALHSLPRNYGYFGFRIFAEKGMLEISDLGFTVTISRQVPNKRYKGFYELAKPVSYGKPRSMFPAVIAHAVAVMDKREKPRGTAAEARDILRVLLALHESASKRGAKVSIS